MKESASTHRESAPDYDRQAEEWGWRPEVFFGLMFEYVQPGENLLDLGIGTGLCSAPFRKAGLKIFGLDGEQGMLDACARKNIAVELKRHDLQSTPYPYPDDFFHHIICGGVFHLFGRLDAIFSQAARMLKRGGTFGFNIGELKAGDETEDSPADQPYFARLFDEASGVKIYYHSDPYIRKLLQANHLAVQKQLVFLASFNPTTKKEYFAKLYVARKERL